MKDDYTSTNFHYVTYTFLFFLMIGRMYFMNSLGVKGFKVQETNIILYKLSSCWSDIKIMCCPVSFLGCLAGLDMVEVNPNLGTADDSSMTAKNAMTLIEVFLGMHHPATLTVPVVESGDSKKESWTRVHNARSIDEGISIFSAWLFTESLFQVSKSVWHTNTSQNEVVIFYYLIYRYWRQVCTQNTFADIETVKI